MIVKIKPLSVNQAWQGRRFKTEKYKSYETEMLLKLPKVNINKKAHLHISITFGYSNPLNDIDNALKPFLDCLQKKYGINDNKIYLLDVKKEIVSKGDEFVEFSIKETEKK